MGIEATINGEPITTLQAIWYSSLFILPWLYGVWALICVFTDKILEPCLRWAIRKAFVD